MQVVSDNFPAISLIRVSMNRLNGTDNRFIGSVIDLLSGLIFL